MQSIDAGSAPALSIGLQTGLKQQDIDARYESSPAAVENLRELVAEMWKRAGNIEAASTSLDVDE